jgi:membrane protein implicated in regulation of membrane protease activity
MPRSSENPSGYPVKVIAVDGLELIVERVEK